MNMNIASFSCSASIVKHLGSCRLSLVLPGSVLALAHRVDLAGSLAKGLEIIPAEVGHFKIQKVKRGARISASPVWLHGLPVTPCARVPLVFKRQPNGHYLAGPVSPAQILPREPRKMGKVKGGAISPARRDPQQMANDIISLLGLLAEAGYRPVYQGSPFSLADFDLVLQSPRSLLRGA